MHEPVAYLNGKIIPFSQARLPVFDLGLVQGAAVTEVVRTFRHVPFRLVDHLDRLFQSLAAVGISAGHSREQLQAISLEVVAQNATLIPASHDLGLVIFVTPGANATYVGRTGSTPLGVPTVCVHTFPLPFELWADSFERGQHLVVPEVLHIPPQTIGPRIKHRSRLHWRLADNQARQRDPLATALLRDHRDLLTETATGNFFVVRNGTIQTPRSGSTLAGVSQQVVSELANELKLPYDEADLTVEAALESDEAFTSSTPYCLCPVTRLNGQPIGSDFPGVVFEKLIKAWNKRVGLDIIEQVRTGAQERAGTTDEPNTR